MEFVKLKELCKMQSGGTPSRGKLEYYDGNIPWAKISDLEKSDDGYIYSTEEHITDDALKSINNRFFKTGTLLLAMYGSVGKTAITKIDLTTNQAILGINIVDEKILNIKYLRFWFTTIKQQLLNRAVGGTLQNISLGIVKELEVPLPPLATQQKIGAILDAADELRQKDKALVAKYDELTQALFLDMFGDTWKNPKGWELKNVEDVAANEKNSIKAGPFGSSLKKELYVEKGYKIYGQEQVIKDNLDFGNYYINERKYKELESCKIKEGDILISLVGTYGKISVVPEKYEEGIINPRLMKISPNTKIIRPNFLKILLQSDGAMMQLKNFSRGGTMDIINVGIVRKITIPLPPIKLQDQFAERVKAIEEQKSIAQASALKSEELFNSLLQKAFNGELV